MKDSFMDVTQDSYLITLPVPGFHEDEIVIKADRHQIRIKGFSQKIFMDLTGWIPDIHCTFTVLDICFDLSDDAQIDKLSHSFSNEVLEVEIPRLKL